MHGASIEGQRVVERKSGANSCGLNGLEGQVSGGKTRQLRGLVLNWRKRRRLTVVEALHSPRLIRFGIFEVDLQAGELRKAGVRLKLTGQPFQVLAILLERPGEVATREELQKRLWPDTFVDIDHNLNTAINKIREVLGDSAENPRFVETLPRRGYRFIAPINQENSGASVGADSERLKGDTASGKTVAVDAVAPDASGNFRRIGVPAAVLAVLAIAATLVWLLLPQAPPRVLATTQLTKDGVPKTRMLTDGSRLYIGESKGATRFLVQVAVTGGETSPIPTPFPGVGIMDITRDHSQLLVANLVGNEPTEFWALPLPSGPPRRLADVAGRAGKWSPDGRQPDGGGIRLLNAAVYGLPTVAISSS
jgi:DNA-binding winged helix-turn-helix (wHTH) protein